MDPSESLRGPTRALEPDPRTCYLVELDVHTQVPQPITLASQHDSVACFNLNAFVPEKVAIHFETAKNLYLYAWFVFRFYAVAEQQALTSLEFALKDRLGNYVRELEEKTAETVPRGLGKLLSQARANGFIRNEALQGREGWALEAAKHRYRSEMLREMMVAGVSKMVIDDSHVFACGAHCG